MTPPDVHARPSAMMKQEAFTFWLPEELGGGSVDKTDQQHEFKFISHREVKE